MKQNLENDVNPTLPNDVSRCDGVKSDDPGKEWREDCGKCLRRTAPRSENAWVMEPPPIIAFECKFLIKPNTYE